MVLLVSQLTLDGSELWLCLVCFRRELIRVVRYVWWGTNLGWIEFRGEIPLNPAVVERPVVGRPLTRWKIQSARLRAHQ